jgi:hypothetical protein
MAADMERWYSTTNNINRYVNFKNRDGSSFVWEITTGQITSVGTQTGYARRGVFKGGTFGVRWTYNTSLSNFNDFYLVIDGLPFTVPHSKKPNVDDQTMPTSGNEYEVEYVVPWYFGDGEHVVDIVFIATTSGTRTYRLNGIIVDSKAGYIPLDSVGVPQSGTVPSAITTSVGSIASSSDLSIMGINEIAYHNPTSKAVAITLRYGTIASNAVIRIVPVAPYSTETVSFGMLYPHAYGTDLVTSFSHEDGVGTTKYSLLTRKA